MNHGSSNAPVLVDLWRASSSLRGTAIHAHQIVWARYMAPMMVNEAMPDATRILMTVSGSRPDEAGLGTSANRQASIVPISHVLE